jgi:hypothetical protein
MPARFDTARAGILVTLAFAVLLAGCGGSSGNGIASKTPAEILAASKIAATSAASVHVRSSTSSGGLSLTLNVELTSNGGRGQISLIGLQFEVIRIGNVLYTKGSSGFYKRLVGAAAHVAPGTWLKGGATGGPLAQLAFYTDLSGELDRLITSTGLIAKGATTAINGQHVVELKEAARLFSGAFFIASTGKPYPNEIVKHGRETGQTSFSGWNQPVSLIAPANAVALK